jgi:hypothetical protein
VFKNTFDAVLEVNTDIPNTTLVGAYVTASNKPVNLNDMGDTVAHINDISGITLSDGNTTTGGSAKIKHAYMLTAQTKAIPMTTVTASYYSLNNISLKIDMNDTNSNFDLYQDNALSADAIWLDAKIADKSLPMGLNIGLQYGNIDPKWENSTLGTALAGEGLTLSDTTAWGVKVGIKPMPALSLTAAYTDVDGGKNGKVNVAVQSVGGVKTPLYTQMVKNQSEISLAADTWMLKAAYNTGDFGTVTLAYADTDRTYQVDPGEKAQDYSELDLVYKVKAGGVNYFVAYVNRDFNGKDAASTADKNYDNDIFRVVARYNF